MSYSEDREVYFKQIESVVDDLMKSKSQVELESRFFKDFGCINFQTEEYMHELNLAREYHTRMHKAFPDRHNPHEEQPYNCYHKTVCKCGFSEAYDSGD